MVAYSGGTLTGAFGTNAARWDEYIASQQRIAKAAADAGATRDPLEPQRVRRRVYKGPPDRGAARSPARTIRSSSGADGVQRYFTVMTECATASKLRAGAK